MNSKLILLLGAVLSSIIVFFCMKEQYKPKNEHLIAKPAIAPKKILPKKKMIILKPPSLNYINDFLKADLSSKDKEKAVEVFKDINLTQNISYYDDINQSIWLNFTKQIIYFSKENNITDMKLNAFAKDIEINATFKDKKIFDDFKQILNTQDFNIKNNTKLLQPPIEKPKKVIKPVQKEVKPKKIDTKKIQNKINSILKKYPIYFEFDSNLLTKEGKKTLDKILNIIKSSKAKFDLKIEGHSNAVGNEAYNKKLSQKRANSVKKYLLKHSKNIKADAKGYGSSKPRIKNPKDKRNRRVEIIIIKGQI